ncbi:MAG: YfhO family protein, partial [Candidatus Omnitrophota bacterium]
ALVDGKRVKIYPADYAFRAITVPAGEHMVTFRFSPFSFKLGVALTVLFLLGTFILCVRPIKL